MRGRQLLVIAVAAAVAACEAQEEPETQEMTTPPATETQPMQPEAVTSDVIARADFQATSAAAGREIRGTAEVRRATGSTTGTGTTGTGTTGTGTTGTGTTGTGTTGTGTTGTGTTGTAGSASEPLELHVRVEGLTAEHAWHIHQGACSQEQAQVVVPFTQPLRATGGTAEQTAPITQLTQQQLESGQYSVRVHDSTAQRAATIACADIQRR
jgi:hypothetical protein